ncbi:MAG: O-antigen ligase family protein [Pseudomonadota bacterium]
MKNYKNFFLTLLLVFAPLAIGSIHTWSITACLVLASIVFSLEVFERGVFTKPPSLGFAGWVFIALCAFVCLQLVPLPAGLAAILSPECADIKTSLYGTLIEGQAPAFMSLTLDRFSTLAALMKLGAGVLLFLAVRQRVRKEGSSGVLWCVAWSGVVVAAIFFIHRLLGWDRVYEYYAPLYASTSPLSAPLLNSNHLAGALGMSSAVAVGLAFSEEEKIKRLLIIVAAGFTGGGVILSLSRGGILCFLGGQVLFIAIRFFTGRAKQSKRFGAEARYLPVALAVGLASGIYVAYKSVLNEFLYGDASKLQIPSDAIPMLRDFWLTGVGRGVFGQGYTLYQQLPDDVTYTSPENFIAQWLTELGVVAGGILILLVLAVLLLGLLKPPMRGRNAGALVALFALTIQNFADYSLELLGVFLPFMTLLSVETVRIEMAYGFARKGKSRAGLTKKIIPTGAAIAGIAAALAIAGAGYYTCSQYSQDRETDEIKQKLLSNVPEKQFLASIDEIMKRHPADYYFPLLAGIKLYHGGNKNPLYYLARSVRLFPRSSVAHLYIARTLRRSGAKGQALLEYMQAVRSRPSHAGTIAAEVVAMTGAFEAAGKMARTRDDKLLIFDPLSLAFLGAGMPEQSALADEALLQIDPFLQGAVARKIRRLISSDDLNEAEKLIKLIEGDNALKPLALELKGELSEKKGDLNTAAGNYLLAWKHAGNQAGQRGLLLKAARIFGSTGDTKRMYKYLDEYKAMAPNDEANGEAILQRAMLEEQTGKYDKALASYQTAASYLPDNASVWLSIASLAVRNNDTARQLKAYKELCRIEPENGKWKEKVDSIQNRLNEYMLK